MHVGATSARPWHPDDVPRDAARQLGAGAPSARRPLAGGHGALDLGHKLTASLNDILAKDGGAIAAHWISHAHQEGYDYRKEHLKYEEDSKKKPFVVRDNWAITRSLMKLDGAIYTDQIEQPAELPFCRCRYVWVYDLTDLPAGMITQKGRAALEAANKAYKERANAA